SAQAQLAVAEPADERCPAAQHAQLAVVHRQGHKLDRLVEDSPLRSDDHALHGGSNHAAYLPSCMRLACSAASSMPPTYMKAPSGRWSHFPSHSSLKLRMVSFSGVTLPGLLVN